MRTNTKSVVLTLALALWATPVRNARADQFAAALQGIGEAVRLSAGRMGVGAFAPADSQPEPEVRNRRQQRIDAARQRIHDSALRTTVTVYSGRDRNAFGSGFLISESGRLMTNVHVVRRNPRELFVEFNDGREYPARLVAAAPGRDIAILQLLPREGETALPRMPFLTMAPQDPAVGHSVYAMGNPEGLGLSFSQGMVSQMGQYRLSESVDYIQSNLTIMPGNSGGPLLNTSGQVVGMNTAIVGHGGRYGLSIPVSELRAFNADDRLVDGTFKGTVHAVGRSAVVGSLGTGPAARGGLAVGDVVLGVDGAALRSDVYDAVHQIRRAFGRKRPDQTVAVRVRHSQAAVLVVPGTGGAAERTAPAYLVDYEGKVFVPAGNGAVLAAARLGGAAPKIRIDGAEYAVRVESDPRSAVGVLQLAPDSGYYLGDMVEETFDVPVDPNTFPVPAS